MNFSLKIQVKIFLMKLDQYYDDEPNGFSERLSLHNTFILTFLVIEMIYLTESFNTEM